MIATDLRPSSEPFKWRHFQSGLSLSNGRWHLRHSALLAAIPTALQLADSTTGTGFTLVADTTAMKISAGVGYIELKHGCFSAFLGAFVVATVLGMIAVG